MTDPLTTADVLAALREHEGAGATGAPAGPHPPPPADPPSAFTHGPRSA